MFGKKKTLSSILGTFTGIMKDLELFSEECVQETVVLNVLRPDAPQLIRIKKGEYNLEKIKTMAEDLFDDARKALMGCALPEEPDHEKAEYILMDMINEIQKSQLDDMGRRGGYALKNVRDDYSSLAYVKKLKEKA